MAVCFRVTLKRVSASAVGIESGTSEESPQTLTTNQFGQTILEEEELTLHWQQKFFSQVCERNFATKYSYMLRHLGFLHN